MSRPVSLQEAGLIVLKCKLLSALGETRKTERKAPLSDISEAEDNLFSPEEEARLKEAFDANEPDSFEKLTEDKFAEFQIWAGDARTDALILKAVLDGRLCVGWEDRAMRFFRVREKE